MRKPAKQQSAIRTPLNHILGTESGVRILRVLSQTRQPMAAADIARMTKLNPTGVRNTIGDLLNSGILISLGTGPRWLVRLRRDHPLSPALRRLFAEEAKRVNTLHREVARMSQELDPPPRSVWIQGSVAGGTDKPGDPVTIGVLGSSADIETTVEALRKKISSLEKEQDLTVEVRGFSKPDLATIPAHEREQILRGISIWGPHPVAFVQESSRKSGRASKSTHEGVDARTLALADRIAQKLRHDPALVERARQRVAERMHTASVGERKELGEWERILRTASPSRLRHLLTDSGPRATRLRQSLPFLDALTHEERDELLKISGTS